MCYESCIEFSVDKMCPSVMLSTVINQLITVLIRTEIHLKDEDILSFK